MTAQDLPDDIAGGPQTNWIGLCLGLGLALGFYFLVPRPESVSAEGWAVGALTILMAVWWVSEAVPLPVTGLLPLIVLPFFGGMSPREAAAAYSNPILYVFLGGFLLAIAIERWRLNVRIAYGIVAAAGPRPRLIVAGFIAATAILSMWISNTATTLMMMPLALGVAAAAREQGPGGNGEDSFGRALVVAVYMVASVAGIATPVGSPTNLIAMGWMTENLGITVDFGAWMMIGVPAMLLLMPVAWLLAVQGLNTANLSGEAAQRQVHEALKGLGRLSTPEWRVGVVFVSMALLWVFATPLGNLPGLQGVDDMTVAILGALVLFILPAGGGEKRSLLVWEDAQKVPWGIIVLFGGGLSLADAATKTGLAAAIGTALEGVGMLPPLLLVFLIVLVMIALTEFASNVATITLMLPILGGLAVASGIAAPAIIVPAAMAASCGFMMPAGTAPNAIAYATGRLSVPQMMRRGLILNLASVVVLSFIGYFVAPHILR